MPLLMRSRPLSVVLLVLGTACYRYVPISTDTPPLGSELRAQLTAEGSTRLTPLLGADVALVEGRVSSVNDSGYVVSVSSTTNKANVQTFWTGESVTLPRGSIQTVEARELNRGRTWMIAAIGIAGGLLAAKIFDLFEGSAGGGDGGGPPPPPP